MQRSLKVLSSREGRALPRRPEPSSHFSVCLSLSLCTAGQKITPPLAEGLYGERRHPWGCLHWHKRLESVEAPNAELVLQV